MATGGGWSTRPSAAGLLALLVLLGSLGSCSAVRPGLAAERASARCTEPVPEIFTRVSPAVVFVAATSINPYRTADRVTHVVGSGFLLQPSGLILTSSHVVYARQSIGVTLDDGTTWPAELVGADPIFDLALLRLPEDAGGTLPVVRLGDSDTLRVGDDVLAIGNPLGLDQSLTRGIVSAINRILPDTPFSLMEPMIQTDAPINPGSSGGPLLDRCGDVVGVNTALISDAQNIGFAIPINVAKAAIPTLLARGHLVRPWIGFHGQLVGDDLRDLLRMPIVEGLLVEVVEPGSPAEKLGLRAGRLELVFDGREYLVGGDIVTSVNGTRLNSTERLFEVMRGLKVGDAVSLTVFRAGEYREVEYRLPERPLLPGDVPDHRALTPVTARRPRPGPPPARPRD